MKSERTERESLNYLIEICRDGERGLMHAADQVSSADVKQLLHEIAVQRREFVDELLPHAQRLGGSTDGEGSVAAKLHRGWMTLRDMVAHDDAAVIKEVERGERATLSAYREALDGIVPPESRDLLEAQSARIQHTYLRLNELLERTGQGA